MALSDFEKRVLVELETSLEHDSPRLAKRLAGGDARRDHLPRRWLTVCGVSLATVGVALMLIGLLAGQDGPWVIVLAGYVVLVIGMCVAVAGWFPFLSCGQR